MFEQFVERFSLAPSGQSTGTSWREPFLMSATGYQELFERFAGCTFENGLYRLRDNRSGPVVAALLAAAFPGYAQRAHPFGYDWLGSQFALDERRVEGGEALVLILEPGTGEALEVPLSFVQFHEQLDDLREAALAATFFAEWAAANPASVPLKHSDCVGYRVPLFLNGQDVIDNLEVSDLDVYWTICGQLRQKTRNLPAGTPIRGVEIED
jgi:hypothetical protein